MNRFVSGQSNCFTFKNDFMKRVINYSSIEGANTIFTMPLQRNQHFFNRYATYGAPVSHCSLILVCRSVVQLKAHHSELTQSSLEANFCRSVIHFKGNQVDFAPSLLDANFCHSIVHLKLNQIELALRLLQSHICRSLIAVIRLNGNQVEFVLSSLQSQICYSPIRLNGNQVDLTQSSREGLVLPVAIRVRGDKAELFHRALFCRGKENATILANRVYAMIAKPRIYRLPFRQKCVGDEDLAHVADPENPLQLQADDVDGRTEDDDDYTDKKDEVLAKSFAVTRGWLRDIRNCLTRMSEAKPAVTVNLIRCKHVQIGEMLNRH